MDSGDEGLQQIPVETGDIHEMAARLWELQSMRLEDSQGEKGTRSGSPTEVMDADTQSEPEQKDVSPLEALRRMVIDNEKKRKAAGEDEASDVHGMGTSEVQKLKYHVPGAMKMPWERGFAGLVLKKDSSVMETSFLDDCKMKSIAMQVDEGAAQAQQEKIEPVQLTLSHKIDGSQKMPWARALETEREKVLEGWKIVIDEARKSCRAAPMLDQAGEEVLDDIFAKKKNGTLQVRLSAMMLYIRWARAKGLQPFPISETQVTSTWISFVRMEPLQPGQTASGVHWLSARAPSVWRAWTRFCRAEE